VSVETTECRRHEADQLGVAARSTLLVTVSVHTAVVDGAERPVEVTRLGYVGDRGRLRFRGVVLHGATVALDDGAAALDVGEDRSPTGEWTSSRPTARRLRSTSRPAIFRAASGGGDARAGRPRAGPARAPQDPAGAVQVAREFVAEMREPVAWQTIALPD
jgi:hypothetical protein